MSIITSTHLVQQYPWLFIFILISAPSLKPYLDGTLLTAPYSSTIGHIDGAGNMVDVDPADGYELNTDLGRDMVRIRFEYPRRIWQESIESWADDLAHSVAPAGPVCAVGVPCLTGFPGLLNPPGTDILHEATFCGNIGAVAIDPTNHRNMIGDYQIVGGGIPTFYPNQAHGASGGPHFCAIAANNVGPTFASHQGCTNVGDPNANFRMTRLYQNDN